MTSACEFFNHPSLYQSDSSIILKILKLLGLTDFDGMPNRLGLF